ncbi:MAG: IS3 family transposase [Sphingobacteriales bacterium]|nr:MAG: IS3 family transposase [Sphingobacteriales bacterium]
MIKKENTALSIAAQYELADVNRSTLYYKPREESVANKELMNRIDELFTRKPFLGARRIQKHLQTIEVPLNIKRIRRLMKKMGLEASFPKRNLSKANHAHRKYPYLLRGLEIKYVNQVWSTDITYIKMKNGFMYLIAVMDWHSRKVLSWKISNTMTIDFCRECLQEAIDNYGAPEIFNTDQGSQFTSPYFINIWKENKKDEVQIIMDGRGRATDNAFIERLWRSVKQEDIYRKDYEDGASLWQA